MSWHEPPRPEDGPTEERPRVVERVEQAIDERTAPPPGGRKYAPGGAADTDALRREQQDEAAGVWGGPGVPAMTQGQTRGLVLGSLVGGAIGVLLFLPVALVPFADEVWVRILVVALTGALAGGTAGALYMGGRESELEGETIDADGRPSVGTTLRDPGTDERGR